MLSIIIPVFNSEAYLEKCVNSVLNQTFIDFELILIDDGSSDKSSLICESFGDEDKRIKIIHQSNQGVSSARNTGLDICKGDYVMFIDSDDWINEDFCDTLMSQVSYADFVIGGYTTLNFNENLEYAMKRKKIIFPNQLGDCFDEMYENNFFNAPFSKIYRKELIGNQRFDTSVLLGEDFLFNLEYLSKCKIIIISETTGYYYNCMNVGAATKKFRENDIKQINFLYKEGKNFLRTYCPNIIDSDVLKKRLCLNGINLIQLICYSDKTRLEKKTLINQMLSSNDFLSACQQEYTLPFKYDMPRRLCVKGNWIILQIFFFFKRQFRNLKGRI